MTTPTWKILFMKKNGEARTMTFQYLRDLPKSLLNERIKGTGRQPAKQNQEVVWDVDKQDFRIINWDQVVEGPEKVTA